MADTNSSIFNKEATERLRSPDDLDKYVRVTNPSIWVILGACVALLGGLLAWGIFGSVSTKIATTGARVDDTVVCFVSADDIEKINMGDVATVEGFPVKVVSWTTVPVSAEEAYTLVESDYLCQALMTEKWAYAVFLEGDLTEINEAVPLDVNITTERVSPLSLILEGRA